MKALIIYDSFFGNTEQIALAIGHSIGNKEEVGMMRVGDVHYDMLKGLELLVVGSPTRQFSPSPATQRFLNGIPSNGLQGLEVAAFDTRIAVADIQSKILRFIVNTGGYAAKSIAKKLVQKGGKLVQDPVGFFVKDKEGPLYEGELERAEMWGEALVKSKVPA
ncbi:MAG: flavodoxin family protein [Saprospirales bacterium]|nr:flavodoxin family protein [Saprospirales bacterium]